MGGLISHSAFVRHPDVFGKIGIFSPSYWFSESYFDEIQSIEKVGSPHLCFSAGQPEGGDIAANTLKMYNLFVERALMKMN
ncbi:MAG: hypothetical protein AAF693_19315 [Bacteroidota bacterium]